MKTVRKSNSAALSNSHGGYGGKTLINRIETQMDNCRKRIEDHITTNGLQDNDLVLQRVRGRYEGLGVALAVLRSSSLKEETLRSNARLEITAQS